MVVLRAKINKRRYIVTLILTLCFFAIGVMLGNLLSNKRLQYIQDKSLEQRLDYESLQTQYLYVNLLGQKGNCPAVEKTFENNIENLENTRLRLEEYEKSSKFNEQTYLLLKREYMIAQLRYWLLAKSTKEICNRDFATILYFYSTEKECPDCHSQEMILTYLKKKFDQNLLIFSLDSNYKQEPMTAILKNVYNISKFPFLIIDDQTFMGLTSKSEILGTICPLYKHNLTECAEIDNASGS